MESSSFKPLISIIVPVFNAQDYLDRLIKSVLGQTYTSWELILVDDGSTDASLEICERYSLKDGRIRVLHQQNSGPSVARNLGIRSAQGQYINFLDSDDWIEKDFIESFKLDGCNLGMDIVFCGMLKEYNDGIVCDMPVPVLRVCTEQEIADFVFAIHKLAMLGWVCNKMYKASIIRKYKLHFDENIRIREDQLFVLDFMKYSKCAASENFCKYHYVIHRGSLMTSKRNYILYQQVSKKVLLGFLQLNVSLKMENYVHNSYLKEYLVGIGAIRKSSEYTNEQKEVFLKECVRYVRHTRSVRFHYSDNILKDKIKFLLFNYAPWRVLKIIML